MTLRAGSGGTVVILVRPTNHPHRQWRSRANNLPRGLDGIGLCSWWPVQRPTPSVKCHIPYNPSGHTAGTSLNRVGSLGSLALNAVVGHGDGVVQEGVARHHYDLLKEGLDEGTAVGQLALMSLGRRPRWSRRCPGRRSCRSRCS